MRRIPAALLVVGLFGGCTIAEPNGLTGNGDFHYDCAGDGDPECDGRSAFEIRTGELPTRPLARGARFQLTFGSGTNELQPASRSAVRRTGPGGFFAEHAGMIGFFVESNDASNDIEDAVRLRVTEADRLSIGLSPSNETFGDGILRVGERLRYRATAFAKDEALAGSMPVTWAIEPKDVVDLEVLGPGVCMLTGLRAGEIRLRASTTELSNEALVKVEGARDASSD